MLERRQNYAESLSYGTPKKSGEGLTASTRSVVRLREGNDNYNVPSAGPLWVASFLSWAARRRTNAAHTFLFAFGVLITCSSFELCKARSSGHSWFNFSALRLGPDFHQFGASFILRTPRHRPVSLLIAALGIGAAFSAELAPQKISDTLEFFTTTCAVPA